MSDRHLRWPASRFYWGVLDGSVLTNGSSAEELGYLFESILPTARIEDVHASYHRLPGPEKRYLACGLRRDAIAQIGNGTVTLTPERIPEFIDAELEPAEINLLTREFEPRSVTRWRRYSAFSAMLIIVASAALVVLGLEQRSRDLRTRVDDLGAAKHALYEQVLGAGALTSALPAERQMTALLRQLERTRSADISLDEQVDCSMSLAQLFASWPREVYALTNSISATPNGMTARLSVDSVSDGQEVAEALDSIPGWHLEQPSYNSPPNQRVQVTLTWSPREPDSEATP